MSHITDWLTWRFRKSSSRASALETTDAVNRAKEIIRDEFIAKVRSFLDNHPNTSLKDHVKPEARLELDERAGTITIAYTGDIDQLAAAIREHINQVSGSIQINLANETIRKNSPLTVIMRHHPESGTLTLECPDISPVSSQLNTARPTAKIDMHPTFKETRQGVVPAIKVSRSDRTSKHGFHPHEETWSLEDQPARNECLDKIAGFIHYALEAQNKMCAEPEGIRNDNS